ncbi:MAG: TolC family protein [Ignavibacteria bacterium]|nr:TolC family protein [Ignavibacteria bacterium]
MRFFYLLIALMVYIPLAINGQNKITLSEAIDMAFERNIDLKKQFAEVKKSELQIDASGRLPNPLFSYSRENLKDDIMKYKEWSASGSLPINFLWDRWSAIESKEKVFEAQKLYYSHLKSNLTSRVSEIYARQSIYSEVYKHLILAYSKINELVEISKHRAKQGDISEYEVQRILIELARLKSIISELEINKRSNENELKIIIGYSLDSVLLTEKPEPIKEITLTLEELIKLALQNRNDLAATHALFASEQSAKTYNILKVIPEINLTAGYKKQDINMSGTVFQVDFEIPLFRRNQYDIKQSEIQMELLEKEKLFLAEKIKAEVVDAFEKFENNRELLLEQSVFDYQNLFNTVSYSYELGELSLIEFIDGLNAYVEGVTLSYKLQLNLYKSFYELEQFTATSLTVKKN